MWIVNLSFHETILIEVHCFLGDKNERFDDLEWFDFVYEE